MKWATKTFKFTNTADVKVSETMHVNGLQTRDSIPINDLYLQSRTFFLVFENKNLWQMQKGKVLKVKESQRNNTIMLFSTVNS